MIDDDLLDDLGTTSNSTPSSGSSSSGPALPETPAPRRRERNQKPNDLKATSNPLLSVPPKIQLAQRGGSAAGALGRSSKSESRDCDSPSNLSPRSDESLSTSPASSSSVKISSPLHVQFGGSLEDRPSATFFPPLSFGVGPEPTSPAPPFVQVHLSTSQPHSLQSSRGSDYSDSDNLTSETANTDTMPSFCPHPSSITISTRDNPPKGFRITTEAGIVIGSAAAYHGSSVSKVSTKAMTQVVSTLSEARNVATQNMLKAASLRGCNAILAMKYDTTSPLPEIFMVTAYGTACVVTKD